MRWNRALDLTATVPGLLVLAPVLGVLALLVKLEDGGPVFFRQTRVGRGGRPFLIWKFRTMVVDAERLGRAITVGEDPRITRVGRWLRRTKADEFPQLLNVLVGEMSLVGPRPEVPCYVDLYTEDQQRVLALRPGITDPASLKYRDEAALLAAQADPDAFYVAQVMPDKIQVNLDYAAQATLGSDLGLIFRTLRVLKDG